MKPLEVRILPVDQLIPAEYNPRTATAKAFRRLKASLETFGLVEPLVWNERTRRVVGGHLRLRALRELGVPDVPVSVVNLSDVDEKALNVVLNNLEAQGRYDPAKLAEIREVPVVIRDIPDDRLLEISLIENIQRAELNPLELATAYRKLMDQFNMTLDQLSKKVGKPQSTIANTTRSSIKV